MSLTIIYTKADQSTMSDTIGFARNLSKDDFDKLVLHIQEVAWHFPNASIVTTENLNAEPLPDVNPAEPDEVAQEALKRFPSEKPVKKETSTKKAA